MHSRVSRSAVYVIALVVGIFGAAAKAESEYDMYRAPPQPVQSLVLLDVSMKMGCAPGQSSPPQGEIACGYSIRGMPPYLPDQEQQERSRLAIVKAAFSGYAQSTPDALKQVGLATYGNGGGVIRVPVSRDTREEFLQTLATLSAGEEPSLVGALLEVGHYFAGQGVVYGRKRMAHGDEAQADASLGTQYEGFLPRWRTQTISHPAAITEGTQRLRREQACADAVATQGPRGLLDTACASEHYEDSPQWPLRYQIPDAPACAEGRAEAPLARDVLLLVSQDNSSPAALEQIIAGASVGVWINRFLSGDPLAQSVHPQCRVSHGSDANVVMQACAVAMVERLHARYNVRVSVAAIGHESEFYARVAAAGAGQYYSVDDAEALQVVLETQLPPVEYTTVPPIAPVISNLIPMQTTEGQMSLLTTQFQASTVGNWWGNIKRYRVNAGNDQLTVVSSQTETSIFETCGETAGRCVSSAARSDWTVTTRPDGKVVTRGGAADTLPPLSGRSAWVQTGNAPVSLQPANSVAALDEGQRQVLERIARAYGWQGSSLLADAQHPLVTVALARYNQFAGVDKDNAEHELLSRLGMESWQHRSQESNTLGASVFGSPLLITYQSTPESRLRVLWWSGTDGFLRAINADTGEWLASVLPEAAIAPVIASEREGAGEAIAGLDTSWVALQHDHNRDGLIRRADGDYVYLYGGLRRAGAHLLALDVTEPESPQVLFHITAGTPGFDALAQAWSTPMLARMRLPGNPVPQTVLVFGGGYDGRHDAERSSVHAPCPMQEAGCGAAVYFVQPNGADAGRLLWTIDRNAGALRHTQVTAMNSPITAPLRGIDTNEDGLTDYLYGLDIEGKLFRIRLPAADAAVPAMQVDLVAVLASDEPEQDNSFFLPPSIALKQGPGRRQEVIIAIGSGQLAQPLTSRGRGALYVITDELMPASALPLTMGSPQAVTLSVAMPESTVGKRLWRLPLRETGEKMMSPPVIVDHRALFLTYVPPAVDSGRCAGQSGAQRLWGVDIRTARPLLDNSGQLNPVTPADYAGTLQSPWVARLVPLLIEGQTFLLQSQGVIRIGAYPEQPERVRWQQVLVGPQVRRH